MKVNMDDLLLAGLLDNDDELILLSQLCSGSDVQNDLATLHRTSFLLVPTRPIDGTYKSQIYFIHSLTDSQRVASILNL